jgi:hypothetical protein
MVLVQVSLQGCDPRVEGSAGLNSPTADSSEGNRFSKPSELFYYLFGGYTEFYLYLPCRLQGIAGTAMNEHSV